MAGLFRSRAAQGCHARGRFSHFLVLIAITVVALAGATSASAAVPDPNPLPGSSFQGGDGNQLANIAPAYTDWQTYANTNANTVVDGTSPDTFYEGKITEPDAWTVGSSTPQVNPGKANAQASSTFKDPLTGDTFFYFSFIRESDSNASTLYALELRKLTTTWVNSKGTTIPCRSNGDLLFTYHVDPSSKSVNIVVYQWTSTSPGPASCPEGKVGSYASITPGPNAQGYMNFDNSITNYLATGTFGNTLTAGRFGEGAVNLTNIIEDFGSTNPCFSYGQAQFFSISAANSFSSALQDMIAPATIDVRNCSAEGTKWSDDDADGVKDAGEAGLAGWTFWVDYDDDGVIDANEPSGISGADGKYAITGINPTAAGAPNGAGPYRIHEKPPSGVTGYTCSFPNSGDAHGCYYEATFATSGNQTGFDFGNIPPGKIIIKKVNVGGTPSDAFNFTASGLNPATFSIPAGTDQEYEDVVANAGGPDAPNNTYTVTEDANGQPTGYSLTDVSCSDSRGTTPSTASLANRNVDVAVSPGETVTCTFTNTKNASVTITKVTDPASDPQDFDFTSQSTGLDSGATLDTEAGDKPDSETFTISGTDLGSKTVEEAAVNGWTLTKVECSGTGSESVDLTAGEVDFDVAAGDDINCTFTNTKDASVTITKVTDPASDPQDFDFTSQSDGLTDGATLDTEAGDKPNSKTFTLDSSQVGSKTVAETGVNGWTLTKVECSGTGSESVDLNAGDVDFDVTAGDDINCTFTNTKDATVTITKVTDPASDPQDFDFTSQSTGLDSGATLDTEAGDKPSSKTFTLNGNQLGSKTVAESAVTGWALTDVQCSGTGSESVDLTAGDVDFDVAAGEDINCTFTNAKESLVTITKVTDPASDPQDFDFTSQSTGLDSGATLDTEAGDKPDSKTFTLTSGQLGAKTISETTTPGWSLDDIDCSGTGSEQADIPNGDVSFTINAGDDINCTFTNVKDATVTIAKVTDPASDPQDFDFTSQSTGLDSGATLDTEAGDKPSSKQFTIANGQFGSKTVAETAVAGWNLDNIDCSGTQTESVDLTARDVDFTVAAGDNITCTFTNVADPGISIDKTGPATAEAGQGILYTINVTNSGPTSFPEANVTVTDALCEAPPALTTKNGDATPTSLDPTETWTYTCTVRTILGQTSVHNVAVVNAIDVHGHPAGDDDPADTTLSQPPIAVTAAGTVVAQAPTSRLRGPNGCVAGSTAKAYVTGTQIKQVKFQLDGKTIKTVKKADSKGRWLVSISAKSLRAGSHRIVATVTYTTGGSRKLPLRFSKCVQQSAAGLTG